MPLSLARDQAVRPNIAGPPAQTNLRRPPAVGRGRRSAALVATVAAYAADHPETELLHLWLADGGNNHCGCAACSVKLPADRYLQLLSKPDAALSEACLSSGCRSLNRSSSPAPTNNGAGGGPPTSSWCPPGARRWRPTSPVKSGGRRHGCY